MGDASSLCNGFLFGMYSGCGLVTCLRCKDTNPKIATYALTYVFRSSVRLYAIFFLCGKIYVWLLSRLGWNLCFMQVCDSCILSVAGKRILNGKFGFTGVCNVVYSFR